MKDQKKIKLDIIGLSYSQTQTGAYALVLGESAGKRRLPIIIGGFEAQAIAIEIEKLTPSRPLTHDLFKSLSTVYNINISEAIIYNLVDGIFYAKLICTDGKVIKEIDSRTSDAIAIAVRFNCPIYTYEFILSSAGIVIEGGDVETVEKSKTKSTVPPKEDRDLSKKSLKDLKEMLANAINRESYEQAALIRDEIVKRKAS